MRVLVCGGRNYCGMDEDEHVYMMLDKIHRQTPITKLIEGGAAGVDTTARRWAGERAINRVTVHADWAAYGRAAGPLRNQRMLDEFTPSLVVAFPGGSGTADMVARAVQAGIGVMMC
jgi:hypothetical protein